MTHNDITRECAKWLKKHKQNIIIPNCSIVIKELKSPTKTGEIPDIIGWCSWASVLIEVKVSKSDFKKDFNKPFRKEYNLGMGNFKYYICPSGLINKEEIPDKWGLLYYEKGNISIIKKAMNHIPNLESERALLITLNKNKIYDN